jgi:hypothetical protein
MTAHRRTLIVLVVAALIGSAVAVMHAATLVLSIGSGSGPAGSDARIALGGTGAAGLGAVQFELAFDPAVLQIKAVEAGSGWPGAMVESNVTAPGRLRVAAVSSQAAAGDGELLVLVVAPLEGGDAVSRLEMVSSRAWEHATNFEMLLKVSPGRFTRVAPQLLGGTRMYGIVVGVLGVVALVGVLAYVLLRKRAPAAGAPAAVAPAAVVGKSRFCPACGNAATPTDRFCRTCGGPL